MSVKWSSQSPPKLYLLDTIISDKNCIIAYGVHGLVPLLGHPLVPCPLFQGPQWTFNGPSIDLPGTLLQWVVPLSLLVPGTSHHGPSYFPLGPYMVFPLVNGSSLLIEYVTQCLGVFHNFFSLATVMEHSLGQNFEINFSHLNNHLNKCQKNSN